MDCIVDDQLWTPEDWTGYDALAAWGPKPPSWFLDPEDFIAAMSGAHSSS